MHLCKFFAIFDAVIKTKKMKKAILFLSIVLSFGQMRAQKDSSWKKTSQENLAGLERQRPNINGQGEQFFTLNVDMLKQSLRNVADKFSNQAGVEISFPNKNGEMENFMVWENSNFAPELQAQYPEIRSYRGMGLTDKTASLNFSLSPSGVQTMIFRADRECEFIEPYNKTANAYVLFTSKNSNKGKLPFACSTEDISINQDLLKDASISGRSNSQVYKTMRLALSCTGEYGG